MFGRKWLKISVARSIVEEEHLKVKVAGGSVADAQLASYNRLKKEGLEDLAGLFMLYHTSLMDVKPPKGDIKFEIKDSTVGSIAFDSEVSNITTTVNALAQQGGKNAEFATALKNLTEAVTSSTELSAEQKKGILEALELVGQQAQEPPDKRKKTIIQSVLENLPKLLGAAASLTALWHNVGPHILAFFK